MTKLLELLKEAQGLGWEFEELLNYGHMYKEDYLGVDDKYTTFSFKGDSCRWVLPTIPEVEQAIVEIARKSGLYRELTYYHTFGDDGLAIGEEEYSYELNPKYDNKLGSVMSEHADRLTASIMLWIELKKLEG